MSELPDRPNLDQLRRQARELLRAATSGEPRALARLRAVSERVTLSAAQLAVAREYGCRSWPALRAEVERRRLSGPAAGTPVPGGDERASPGGLEERWSFGGAAAIETSAGVLFPEALVAGAGRAVLYGSLVLSGNGVPAAARPRRMPVPRMPFAGWARRRGARATVLARRRNADAAVTVMTRISDDVIVVDDRGARYALRSERMSGKRGPSGEPAGPWSVQLRLDPVPARGVGWLELRSKDGAAARLLPSARPAVRIGQLTPVATSQAEREPLDQPPAPDAARRADGPRRHLDLGTALPPVDGVAVQLDCLISMPGSWRLYLRAMPGRRDSGEDGRWRDMLSVHADDDLGGAYLSNLGGPAAWPRDGDEFGLRFLPRLNPLARALKLTFRGASEELAVDLSLE